MPRRLIVALLAVSLLLSSSFGDAAGAAGPAEKPVKPDYFISPATVIIGCTSGAAAGALAAGMPITAAMATGTAVVPSAWAFMITITYLGCVIGAATGAVAVGTAWLLERAHPE